MDVEQFIDALPDLAGNDLSDKPEMIFLYQGKVLKPKSIALKQEYTVPERGVLTPYEDCVTSKVEVNLV